MNNSIQVVRYNEGYLHNIACDIIYTKNKDRKRQIAEFKRYPKDDITFYTEDEGSYFEDMIVKFHMTQFAKAGVDSPKKFNKITCVIDMIKDITRDIINQINEGECHNMHDLEQLWYEGVNIHYAVLDDMQKKLHF